ARYVHLRVDLRYNSWTKLLRKWLKPKEYKIFQLTGIGLEIYRKIAERRLRVIDLIYYLQDQYKLSFLEARAFITQYLGVLMRNGVIVIEVNSSIKPQNEGDN
ncbi:MAG: hypothetical protein RRY34_06515, partial [Victivallaceae bacterium]